MQSIVETLTSNAYAFAPLFVAGELLAGLMFVIFLRRFKARGLPLSPNGRNPFNQPIALILLISVALTITGLAITVGRGWCLVIQSPLLIASFLAKHNVRNEGANIGATTGAPIVNRPRNGGAWRNITIAVLSAGILFVFFLLMDSTGTSITKTSGRIIYEQQYVSNISSRVKCKYRVSVPEGIARGTFDQPCEFSIGQRVEMDVRVGRITGLVRIVGGSLQKASDAI